MAGFYDYFNENMEALGLPAPKGLFGTMQSAIATSSVILGLIDKLGKRVTVGEIIGAGTALEELGAVAGISACFYAGAVIGSIAVATGRVISGGRSLGETLFDVLHTAESNHLSREWLHKTLHRWPGIYDTTIDARDEYRLRA